MANLSQIKRQRMLDFLNKLKQENNDEEYLMALSEIENELTSKRYGLVWEKHEEQVDIDIKTNVPVFTEIKDKELKIGDEAYNFLLEGDNLHSLKLLEKTHKGRIDVIYIDPPYNTGSNDFIYEDNIVNNDDTFKHSKWLSFMEERLLIAYKLLADDGMIMISINDVELYSLKMLCDFIFGDNNFLANMIWQSTPGSNTGNTLKTVTEYVLVYAKDSSKCKIATDNNVDDTKYKFEDETVNRRGRYITNKLDRRMTGQHYSDALNYPLIMPDGSQLYAGGKNYKQEHWNWRWSADKVKWGVENNFIIFKKTTKGWSVYFKQYQFVDNNDNPIERSVPFQNLIKIDGANSARGTQEVMSIMNRKAFDYPKPLNLIIHLLKLHAKKDSIILDFFAGSGTTGQAVLTQNQVDKGTRKFILCTNNQNKICEEVTYERIKRVIQGYGNNKPLFANLKYYKTDMLPKTSKDDFYSVGEELKKHIAEMVQLERGISLDNNDYYLVLNENDLDKLDNNDEFVSKLKAIYISSEIFLPKEIQNKLKETDIILIPEYYFEDELKEAGEL